jgi:hypothetical protein
MTKTTQQKLARQAITFLDYGGKAMTALVRMLLLSLAVVFEGIGIVLLVLESSMDHEAGKAERVRKGSPVRAIKFKTLPHGERSGLEAAYAYKSAPALAATASGRARHA